MGRRCGMLEVLVEVRRDAMRAELSVLGRARGGEGRASAAVRATKGLAALEKLERVGRRTRRTRPHPSSGMSLGLTPAVLPSAVRCAA